ncbi:MAG: TonB-dependent receptor, partial [Bacteroidales bacterium]|nr:TonB-dependent receptor [Bacteroidales bacterium]
KSEFINFSISGGITKKFNERLSFSLALGRGQRSPDVTERFIILLPIGYDKFDYLGDPKIKPEANNQADLTLKYLNNNFGYFEITGFFSYVNNYISGKIIPPSVQKPLSTDVLGVKQFHNAGDAKLRGFEFLYRSPEKYKLTASLIAGYTYGTLGKAEKYILNENGEVTGKTIVKNDAITEIPPLESTISAQYRFFHNNFIPAFSFRFVASQDHISEATYEKSSPGFITAGFSFLVRFNRILSFTGGVHNIFNQAYYEHLNRNIIGTANNLYEPGRRFYINLLLKI